ncbi:glycoside hydrolase family 88 protein [Niabella aurantiaca]|uniref:glycoside hydrolase family 88 protein n=1 Tax=Niabella aurantiaca TaxID=379900 RepID=UPI00036D19F5|nr:glycoside hydrolase family 88 protein [Niabella aurantiaca]
MKQIALIAILLFTSFLLLHARPPGLGDQQIARIFSLERKYLQNAWDSVKATGRMPRSPQKGFQPIEDWTSGFYAGSLWLVYQFTGDKTMLQKARQATAMLEADKDLTHNHDIGFIMYCSYGNGYRLTRDPAYKNILIHSARTALTRYNPRVQSIMSWNPQPERDWKFPVIIDNMMNLELLLKATALGGDSSFYRVAVAHANTTLKHQYRSDYSCSHVVDYDPQTGAMRRRDWNNGNSDPATAAWSRGQAWGLYGFGFMYRDTRDQTYLQQADHIAAYILNHPNMPGDMVPYWDYSAPEISAMRDASAAAITASALLQLAPLSVHGKKYFAAAEKILSSLASPGYLNETGKGLFLLKHATGNYLRKSELDAGLIYADYYFLEALLRYKELKKKYRSV